MSTITVSKELAFSSYTQYTYMQVLILLYLVGVVWMVRRQTRQVKEERIILTYKKGKASVKKAAGILDNKNEVLI